MSLLIDASGDQLRGAAPTATTNFTIVGRAYIVANRGAGNVQTLVCMSSSGNNDVLAYLAWNEGVGSMAIGSYDGTTGNESTFASRPAVGDWFMFYLRCGGSGTNQLEGGFMLEGSDTITTQTSTLTTTAASATVARTEFGSNIAFTGDYANVRVSNMRLWNAVLTDSEIRAEFNNLAAVRTSNLVYDVPADHGTVALSILDYSGNANNFTQSGVAVAVDAPMEDILHPNWGFFQVGGTQSINVGLNSETDSAFAVTWTKSKAVGLNTEADSVLAVARTKNKAVALSTETDSAFTHTWGKSKALGLNTESDTSFTVAARKNIAVGLAQETDSAFTHTWGKSKALGLNTESDTSFTVAARKNIAVGLAQETDSVFTTGWNKRRTVGLNVESDSVLALTANKRRALGLSTETDTAFSLTGSQNISVGLASEADSAFSVAWRKQKALGLATETDSGFAITPTRVVSVALNTETDSSFSVGRRKSKLLGLASESDTAFVVEGGAQFISVGMALEVDTALAVWRGSGLLIDGDNQSVMNTPYGSRTFYSNGSGSFFSLN